MEQSRIFHILNEVASTNNYAMAKVHEGLATNGTAWFAHTQSAGKGQRGRTWQSEPGKAIHLSIVLSPSLIFRVKAFYLSALVAVCCREFLSSKTGHNFFIKWPNDLYWGDRKAGGILIENIFLGGYWKWAVAGIGINVNKMQFDETTQRAVSLHGITGQEYDVVALARELHEYIMDRMEAVNEDSGKTIMDAYNEHLYCKDSKVRLRSNQAGFYTTIKGVNNNGQLLTEDVIERQFDFGTVEWLL